MLFKGSAGSAILKGIAVQKVVAASAAAVVTVSAVGTAAKLSSDYIASNSQPAEPQSTIVAQELDAPAAAQPEGVPAQGAFAAEASPATAGAAPAGHVTSIREGDQVIRREYYDENSDLLEYSDLVDYDPETNSYTENVYRYDEETGREILVRTDTYQNGQLVASDTQSAPGTQSKPAATQVPDAAPSPAPKPAWQGHITAITEDGQVIRREYYDTDGRLCEYSDVVNDSETGSYVENVYRYDKETDTEILVRTETGQNTPAPTAAPAAPSEPSAPSEPAPPAPSDPEPPAPSDPAPSEPEPPAPSDPAPQNESGGSSEPGE